MSGIITPAAYITVDKQRLKQNVTGRGTFMSKGTVYLKNNEEFEIELYNPTKKRILAVISVNGSSIGPGLIINPGQRTFLDRFIDTKHKFLFNTYEVEDNNETKVATELNGLVEVNFYNEQDNYVQLSTQNWNTNRIFYDGPLGGYNHMGHPTWRSIWDNMPLTGQTNAVGNNQFLNGDGGFSTLNNLCSFNDNNVSLTSFNTVNTGQTLSGTKTFNTDVNSTETGRVEKGSVSNQNFHQVEASFENIVLSKSTWKILPKSQEVITVDDIVLYCGNCGSRKKKDNHRFCPQCGTKY